jgi:YggT family protein
MSVLWAAVALVLWVYLLLVLARLVVEVTRQFARAWRPVGVAAVGVELVYMSTDPPMKLLRRLIPPLRIGGVALDLSIAVLLIAIVALRQVAITLI